MTAVTSVLAIHSIGTVITDKKIAAVNSGSKSSDTVNSTVRVVGSINRKSSDGNDRSDGRNGSNGNNRIGGSDCGDCSKSTDGSAMSDGSDGAAMTEVL